MKSSVLIVGAGPVGMILACNLKKFGITARVIEKRADCSGGSKALAINAASLKVFDGMGIIDEFLKAGESVTHINVHWANQRFIHVNYNHLNGPYPFFLSLPQPITEEILTRHFLKLGGNIERKVSLQSLRHLPNGAEVDLLHADGSTETSQYDYVIGCDGGKSAVRQSIGKKFVGHDYDMYFLLI